MPIRHSMDPFQIFADLADSSAYGLLRSSVLHELATQIDYVLTQLELKAVGTAPVVAGAAEFLKLLESHRIPFGVVTNNSQSAVDLFARTRLPMMLGAPVIGRQPLRPDLLKPNPWGLRTLAATLGEQIGRTTWLVGDSLADVLAGQEAGCSIVGMGSTTTKYTRLVGLLGEGAVVRDYSPLTRVLTSVGHARPRLVQPQAVAPRSRADRCGMT